MVLLKARFPVFAQVAVGEVVTSPHADRAGHLSLGHVTRKVIQIELIRRIEGLVSLALHQCVARLLDGRRVAKPVVLGAHHAHAKRQA